jgi:elongation factor P hydroxylase
MVIHLEVHENYRFRLGIENLHGNCVRLRQAKNERVYERVLKSVWSVVKMIHLEVHENYRFRQEIENLHGNCVRLWQAKNERVYERVQRSDIPEIDR